MGKIFHSYNIGNRLLEKSTEKKKMKERNLFIFENTL